MKMKFEIRMLLMIFTAATISSGCAALSGMLGGLTLSDSDLQLASENKSGYVVQTSAAADPAADDGYIYGLYKAN